MNHIFSNDPSMTPYSLLAVVILLVIVLFGILLLSSKSNHGVKVSQVETRGIFSDGIDSNEEGVRGLATKGSIFTIFTKGPDKEEVKV